MAERSVVAARLKYAQDKADDAIALREKLRNQLNQAQAQAEAWTESLALLHAMAEDVAYD